MRAEAVVLSVSGNKAKVKSVRQSACASCASCESKGHCHAQLIFGDQDSSIVTEVYNTAGAKTGDRVMLASTGANILLLSMLVFVLPVVVSVLFYLLSAQVFTSEYVPVIFLAVTFFVCFVLCALFCDRYAKKNLKTEIVKIIEESEEEHFFADDDDKEN